MCAKILFKTLNNQVFKNTFLININNQCLGTPKIYFFLNSRLTSDCKHFSSWIRKMFDNKWTANKLHLLFFLNTLDRSVVYFTILITITRTCGCNGTLITVVIVVVIVIVLFRACKKRNPIVFEKTAKTRRFDTSQDSLLKNWT